MPCKFKEFSIAKLLMEYPSQFRLDDYDFLLERQLGCVVLYIGPLDHEYCAAPANESYAISVCSLPYSGLGPSGLVYYLFYLNEMTRSSPA